MRVFLLVDHKVHHRLLAYTETVEPIGKYRFGDPLLVWQHKVKPGGAAASHRITPFVGETEKLLLCHPSEAAAGSPRSCGSCSMCALCCVRCENPPRDRFGDM